MLNVTCIVESTGNAAAKRRNGPRVGLLKSSTSDAWWDALDVFGDFCRCLLLNHSIWERERWRAWETVAPIN